MSRNWYEIKMKANTADIYIYDEIGWFGITAKDFIKELAGLTGKALNVFINSPGGDVFDGIAIYNALSRHEAGVNVTVDALAASIASVIAQAGESRTMAQSSSMMIHDAWGIAIGNASVMEKMQGELDQISDSIAEIYAKRAGGTAGEWRQKMTDETWFKADAAVEAGLADAVVGAPQNTYAGRIFNLSKFKNVPDWVQQDDKPAEKPGEEPEISPKEDDMDEEAIRQALGLDGEGDILGAIGGLKGQVTILTQTLQSDAPDKGEIATIRAQLSEAQQLVLRLDNEKNRENLELRQKVHNMEAEARVEKAINSGRITPALRPYALQFALNNSEEEFAKMVKNLPRVDLNERGSSAGAEFEAFEPTETEIAIAKQMGQWNEADVAGSKLALMRAKGAKIPARKES